MSSSDFKLRTLASLAADLAGGRTTSRALVEHCLQRIQDPDGEGWRTFLKVSADTALAAADFQDRLRKSGAAPSPFAGIPVSIKDLFDIAGDVTTAGSRVLRNEPAAMRDAASVARLRAAGFIAIGRTNMTEFAFSGLGLNPHFNTPRSPYDRANGRIPGGSSSGAAVSVSDQMSFIGLGTDTGGSCRIPAALCGIVGFKPTANRVSREGAFPLSNSLDSIGPLGASVECCATVDAVLAGEHSTQLPQIDLRGLRFAVPQSIVLENMDDTVAHAFNSALEAISRAGARIVEIPLAELLELPRINHKGGLVVAEAYALHRSRVATHGDEYDPRVSSRLLRGKEQDSADYIDLVEARADFIRRVNAIVGSYDAMLMPTVPTIAPLISQLEADADYYRINGLMLRNPSILNFLDGCAVSIPCHDPGDAPVGLSIAGIHGADRRVLAIAAAVERLSSVSALIA